MASQARIDPGWATRFGDLLAAFWDLEFELRRGEAYLGGISWEAANADDGRRRWTLGVVWAKFVKRASEVRADAAQLDTLRALMTATDEREGLLHVRNAIAHGFWRTDRRNGAFLNLSKPRDGKWKGRARQMDQGEYAALRRELDEAIRLARTLANQTCRQLGFNINGLAGIPEGESG